MRDILPLLTFASGPRDICSLFVSPDFYFPFSFINKKMCL